MRRIIIFSLINGTVTGFQKEFESSFALPSIGTIIPLGSEGEPKGTLKQGVVVNVRVTENSVKVGTEDASTEVLRTVLTKDSGYTEVPLPTW